LVVEAGTTASLTLVGDLVNSAFAGVSNQHYFYVASAADVTSNAQSVAGDFPVAGNTFTMGSVAVTSLAISAGSEPSQPVVGASNVEIAAFKLAAGAENDVALHQITLTQNGSLSSSKIVNLRLLRGTDEVGYATGFDGDLVAFVLETPFVIDKGQTKNFYVRADIDGGRPNDDSIQLYLDESTDLVGIDQQYGYGTTVTNNYTTAFSLPITLKGGKVTVADNGPAAHQVAQNTTNVALLDFSITADRDIDVKDMDLQLMAGIGGNFSDVPVPTLVPVTSAIAAGTTATPAVPATFATGALQDVAISAATAGLAGSSQTVTVTMIAAATLACNVTAGGAALAIECEAGATTATLAAAIASDGLFTTTGGSVALATAGTVTLTGGADLIPEVLAGATPNLRTGFMTTTAHAGDVADVFSVTISGTTYYCALATAAPDTSVANVTTDCPAVTPAGGEIITWGLDPYQWIENVRIVDIDTGATLQGPVTRFNATTVSTGPLNTTYSKKMSEDYSLVAGDTRHLRVEADFNQNMPSGLEVQAYINFKPALSAYLKDVDANKAVPTGDIVGGEMTGKKMTIKQNSLTVAKTTNVLTRQHVKGSQGVNALQIALQAGDAGDITVKKLIMRVYADDDGTFNNLGGAATGDVEAKNYISSVSLYDGDTLVAGPVALELVGGLVGATYLPETATSYDKALFENFSLVIPKGQTKNLTVKFNLLNNTGALTYYLAVDMDPAADITAEDVDSNTVTASSGHLNLLASPTPQIVMIGSGSLSASVTGSYSPEVYVGGTNDLLVAQYKFTAEKEAYTVNTLTVLNDADGILNTAEETNVIENVVLVYTDINGSEQTRSGSLTAGLSVKFSDLGFYIPEEGGATLKIYADTKAIDTQFFSLSGKKFKLALKELNTGSSEFEAIGVSSSEANYFLAPTDITGAANLATNVLRRAKPIFTHLPNTNVLSTTNNFYQFSVTANGGDVTLGRLVFDVATSGTVTGVANLRIQSSDTSLQSVGDVSGSTVTIVGAQAIVAFDQQQTIPSGDTFYYVLKGDIVGGLADNDSVEVRFASGDEAVEVTNALAGAGYDNDNDLVLLTANTTYLSGAAAGQGLFVTGGYLGTVGTALNVVWSDHSGGNSCSSLDPVADPGCTVLGTAVSKGHVYPEIVAGAVTPDSGTADWTNGYLLNIEQLDPTNLTK
ncbi:hypothetical protein KAR91_60725, partial [Candidatus Pacearchaeota archaeon]|nr:hypothetical protein [Candidatus Pacearchaeota archaeon]